MTWRSDNRAVSPVTKLVLYGIAGLVALMVVLTIISVIVSTVIGLLMLLVPILLIGAVIYLLVAYASKDKSSAGGLDGYGFETDSFESTRTADSASAPQDPHDRLTEQYIRGEISEAEYERRISEYLDAPSDSLSDFDADRSREREFER